MLKKITSRFKSIQQYHILVLLFVIIVVVLVIKFFGRQADWRTIKVQVVGQDWSNNYRNYEGYRPPYWLAESIHKGDVELGSDSEKIAEVVQLERYKRGGPDYDLYLTVNLKGTLNTRTNKFVYKGRAVEVGAPIDLRLNNTLVLGQVIDNQVPEGGYETKEIIVVGRRRNVKPWNISNLNIGDMMTIGDDGGVIAELLDFKVEPALNQVVLSTSPQGDVTIKNDPTLKDIEITVKIIVENHAGEWYFGGHQYVKVGNLIWFFFPRVDLSFIEIVSITDVIPDEIPQK